MGQQYSSYARPPGAQSPGKYPMVGPNYGIYGEQPGYVYNPWTDRYDPDRKQVQQYQEATGQAEPKPHSPGTSDLILPLAVVGGTGMVVNEIGKGTGESIGNSIFGTKDPTTGVRTGGMFGKPTPPAQPAGPAQGAAPAGGVPPIEPSGGLNAQPTGMFGGSGTGGGGAGGVDPGASSMSATSADVQVIPAGQAVPEGYTAVGAAADGSGAQVAVPADKVASDGSVNLGQAAQGILGAYSLYQGYRAYQQGDYLGAGINAGLGAAAVGSALGNSTASAALPFVGPIAGLYTGYRTANAIGDMPQGSERNQTGAMGGAATGASIGSAFGPMGTAIGAGVGALAGIALSLAGSGKDKYQMMRDKGRDYLKEAHILDDNYMGTLADGSQFDFGKDGKVYGKGQFDNPLYGKAAAYGNALAAAEGLTGKSKEAMATLYGNAAVSNAKDPSTVAANFQHFAQQRGMNPQAVQAQFDSMLQKKEITQHEHDVYTNDMREFMGGGAPAPGAGNAPPGPSGMMGPRGPQNLGGGQPGAQPTPQPQRSSTLRPGIGLDGLKIDYSKKPQPTGMMRKPVPL